MRFDSYHPAINLLFFAAALAAAVAFDHPACLLISFLCPFVYAAALRGWRTAAGNALLLPLAALFALYYASYHHFGVTELAASFTGNRLTLESLAFGFVIGVKVASVLLWLECVHAVVTSDKLIYLLGRVLPRLSLFLSIALRMAPRIRDCARRVGTAQRCIGRGPGQGDALRRLSRFFRCASIVVTWTLDDLVSTADSMRSRGYSLPGRTAFSLYRFDNRDRALVVALFACLTVLAAGAALDQMSALYAPAIVVNPVTPGSFLFYGDYLLLGLLPLLLQLVGERRARRLATAGG